MATVVLKTDAPVFTIVDANEAYLKITETVGQLIIGKGIFEVFPDRPESKSPEVLEGTYLEVIKSRLPNSTTFLRYDLEIDPSSYEKRYWDVLNHPVKDTSGKVTFIISQITERSEIIKIKEEHQADKAHIQSLAESINGVLWEADAKTLAITYVSPQVERVFGYSPKQWTGEPEFWERHLHPEDKEATIRYHREKVKKGKDHNFEYRLFAADGRVIWIHALVTMTMDDSMPSRLKGIMIDISKRKFAEAAKRQAEIDIKKIHDQSMDIICTADAKGNFLTMNAASKQILGYEPEEMIGKSVFDFIYPEDLPATRAIAKQIREEGKTITNFENRYFHKSGKLVPLLWSSRWEKNEEILYSIARDATEMNALLTERSLMLNNTDEAFVLINKELKIVTFNQQYCDIHKDYFGLKVEKGARILDYVPRDRRGKVTEICKSVLNGKRDREQVQVSLTNKPIRYYENRYKPAKDDSGKIIGIFITTIETTDFELAQADIKAINQRFELVTEAISDAIWDHHFISGDYFWGKGFKKLFGHDELGPRKNYRLWEKNIHPDDKERILESVKSFLESDKKTWEGEYRFRKSKGTYAYVLDKGLVVRDSKNKPIRFVGAMQDISKRKREETQLRLLESVVTNTTDAVMVTQAEPFDEPGPKIIHVNDAFTRITGYKAIEVIGKTPRILQGPKTDREELINLKKALKNWESHECTILNYKKNGEEFWNNLSITPVANKKGWYTHWVAIERDATDRMNAELANRTLAKISGIFNSEKAINTTLNRVLEVLSEQSDFCMAEAWLLNRDKNKINLVSKCITDSEMKVFYKNTHSQKSFKKGEGLPGQIWTTKKSELWRHVYRRKSFVRNHAAAAVGLKSVFGFPLLHGKEMIGVIILGLRRDEKWDKQFRALFGSLEQYIGSEIKRKQQEEESHNFFQHAPDILAVAGPDGYFRKVNPAFAALLGYTEKELTTKPIFSFVHPDDRDNTEIEYKKNAFGISRAFNFENRYFTKSGNVVWISWSSSEISNMDGMFFAYGRDITEQKELQNLLDDANLAKIGSWERDPVNGTSYWSQMTCRIYEIPENFNPDFKSYLKFYKDKESQIAISDALNKAIKNGKSWDLELEITTGKGNKKWVRTIGKADLVDGKCLRLFGRIQDINDRKLAELELVKRAKELAISNAELEQFAFVASHDLQEPLRMVTSFMTQLEKKYKDELDEKALQYIHFAVDGAKRMRQIILDLLEFSKVGKEQENLQDLKIESIIEEVSLLLRKSIEEKDAKITIKNLPVIRCYRGPVTQIFQNLITNSLKYAIKGIPPKIEISCIEKEDHWQFLIKDNGMGIEEEYFDKIFIVFQRLHQKEQYEGSGMGLAIVKKIIDNLGGKIWVKSEINKGSNFYFTLPKDNL